MAGGLQRNRSSFFAFIENEVLSLESVMVYKVRHCIDGPQSLLDSVLQRSDGVIDFVTFWVDLDEKNAKR